jgi:hypothetical protein
MHVGSSERMACCCFNICVMAQFDYHTRFSATFRREPAEWSSNDIDLRQDDDWEEVDEEDGDELETFTQERAPSLASTEEKNASVFRPLDEIQRLLYDDVRIRIGSILFDGNKIFIEIPLDN